MLQSLPAAMHSAFISSSFRMYSALLFLASMFFGSFALMIKNESTWGGLLSHLLSSSTTSWWLIFLASFRFMCKSLSFFILSAYFSFADKLLPKIAMVTFHFGKRLKT